MPTPVNQSSNLHQTHRENHMSNASSVLKTLADKGILFSTSVEVRPGNVGLCVCEFRLGCGR